MTWLKHPGNLHFLTFSVFDLWIGKGTDSGKFAYKTTVSGATKYVVTDGFVGYKMKVDGTILNPVFSDVNGALHFQGGNFILYRRTNNNWVLMESASWQNAPISPGYTPVAWLNWESQQMEGDAWWEGSLPTAGDEEFAPEGTAVGTRTVSLYMPRWEKAANAYGQSSSLTSSVVGTYTDPDGVYGDLVIGTRAWTDESHRRYEKSLEKVNGSYTYGTIHRDYTHLPWVIGTYESPDGWMEGDEPSTENPVTFSFATNAVNDLIVTVFGLFSHNYNSTFSSVYYDAASHTFRISVPDVTETAGWLECAENTLQQTLTFTKGDETQNFTISELLKGEVAGLDVRDGALYVGDWECHDVRLGDSVTFTYTHASVNSKSISYDCLELSSCKADVLLGEVAIWR